MTKHSHRIFIRSLMAGVSLSVLASAALAASATPMNPLPTQDWTTASGISGDGSVIVGLSENPSHTAVYWGVDGVAHDIGIGGLWSVANGISRDGSIIVGRITTSDVPLDYSAWAYRIGDVGYTVLPKTVFGGATNTSNAFGASADGSVIVGEQGIDVATVAVMWSGPGWTTETSLGTLPGPVNNTSSARAVSDDGSIVVGNSTDNDGVAGFFWTAGVMEALKAPGLLNSIVYDISGDGSTIVGYGGGGGFAGGFWSGPAFATFTDIGTLGGASALPLAVNYDGSVIVGTANAPGFIELHAFRYANGTMKDINTLLTDAGVNMAGITLTRANDVSASGEYIVAVANSSSDLAYLVYLPLGGGGGGGGGGGITTSQVQIDSVGQLCKSRQALAIQQNIYTGLMTGELDPSTQGNHGGLTGLYGSVSGSLGGQVQLADHLMLLGGVTGGSNSYDTFDYDGMLAALALRYDFASLDNGLQPFAEIGGDYGALNDLTFERTYANGAGTATGKGNTSGHVGSLYAKAGVVSALTSSDQLVVAAETGERWLSTDAYTESLAGNPFPAAVESGTDRQTIVKASAKWTHTFTPAIDMTLRAAAASVVEGSGGVRVTTTGGGIVHTSIENQPWFEGGARLGWQVSDTTQINLYATGMSGEAVEPALHVGAGVQVTF